LVPISERTPTRRYFSLVVPRGYPTVRLRLDRLIEKVKLLDRQDIASPFERVLRIQHAEGKIDRQTLKLLLEAHQSDVARQRNAWERSPQ
jgi:hypothetical protein